MDVHKPDDHLQTIHLTNFDFETTDIFRKEFMSYFVVEAQKKNPAVQKIDKNNGFGVKQTFKSGSQSY